MKSSSKETEPFTSKACERKTYDEYHFTEGDLIAFAKSQLAAKYNLAPGRIKVRESMRTGYCVCFAVDLTPDVKTIRKKPTGLKGEPNG